MIYNYHYKADSGNFGDDLNRVLWADYPSLGQLAYVGHSRCTNLDFRDDDIIVTLIGTILDARVPTVPERWIFGSGAGYNEKLQLTERTKTYFVRGPMTARSLDLPDACAITDPAILVADWATKLPSLGSSGVAFIPHHDSVGNGTWLEVCAELGWDYIDPRASPLAVAASITRAELILTEAMHGAIFADSLRRPWVLISSNPKINAFKWQDWCASMGVSYLPIHVPALHYPRQGLAQAAKHRIKLHQAKAILRKAIGAGRPCLSQESVFRSRLSQIREQVANICSDLDLKGQ